MLGGDVNGGGTDDIIIIGTFYANSSAGMPYIYILYG
jgi:hypothetical protein